MTFDKRSLTTAVAFTGQRPLLPGDLHCLPWALRPTPPVYLTNGTTALKARTFAVALAVEKVEAPRDALEVTETDEETVDAAEVGDNTKHNR